MSQQDTAARTLEADVRDLQLKLVELSTNLQHASEVAKTATERAERAEHQSIMAEQNAKEYSTERLARSEERTLKAAQDAKDYSHRSTLRILGIGTAGGLIAFVGILVSSFISVNSWVDKRTNELASQRIDDALKQYSWDAEVRKAVDAEIGKVLV